jgi:uncharacterized protein (TIGR02147 family)
MVSVYEYLDYRQFLRDYYEDRKRTTKTMSYRNFARAGGLGSWNYLKLVTDGKRNLTAVSIKQFAKALKLKKREGQFFAHLVMMNQAKDPEEKNKHYEKLMTFRRFDDIHRMENDVYNLLSRWYVAAVHELVALADFDSDPKWIAERLEPSITVSEAGEALEVLLRLKLLKVDPYTGKAKQTKGHFTTPDSVADIAIYNYQKEMLALAHRALRKAEPKDRDVSGLTIALTKKQKGEATELIREFRRDLHAKLTSGGKPDAVYQINFQIFPLSEVGHD